MNRSAKPNIPESDDLRPEISARPLLMITGDRRNKQYLVFVQGKPIWMAFHLLETLVRLVQANANGGTGIVALNPEYVRRLRRAIDSGVGAGTGRKLIVTGDGKEYRLDAPACEVVIDPTFNELVPKCFTAADLELLSRECQFAVESVLALAGEGR